MNVSSISRVFSHLRTHSTCQKELISRHYSTRLARPVKRDWLSGAHPAPHSILDDDSTGAIDLSENSDAVDGARPNTPPLHCRKPSCQPTPSEYRSHAKVMKDAFPEGWKPPRRLSRQAMDGLRQMHHLDPRMFTTPVLSERFRISPEAVRRILKSKWEPTREQRARFAEKEKANRLEFIEKSRMEEARHIAEFDEARREEEQTKWRIEVEAKRKEETKKQTEMEKARREGKIVGRSAKDSLTLI